LTSGFLDAAGYIAEGFLRQELSKAEHTPQQGMDEQQGLAQNFGQNP
jgi:hypothetical protein